MTSSESPRDDHQEERNNNNDGGDTTEKIQSKEAFPSGYDAEGNLLSDNLEMQIRGEPLVFRPILGGAQFNIIF